MSTAAFNNNKTAGPTPVQAARIHSFLERGILIYQNETRTRGTRGLDPELGGLWLPLSDVGALSALSLEASKLHAIYM